MDDEEGNIAKSNLKMKSKDKEQSRKEQIRKGGLNKSH